MPLGLCPNCLSGFPDFAEEAPRFRGFKQAKHSGLMLSIIAVGGEECNFQIFKCDARKQDPYFVELVSCER